MCTRYITPDQAAVERAWEIGRRSGPVWAAELFPRSLGPFLRAAGPDGLELVVGTWGLIPPWSKTPALAYATQNCRAEEAAQKPSFRDAWRRGQRCIVPAMSFDEPCWESGRNVWWRFRRADGAPWGLAGLWNAWVDPTSGEIVESYTLLTVNADAHPLFSRMHKPDPRQPPNAHDKRSVVALEYGDRERWLCGSPAEIAPLLLPPAPELVAGGPLPEKPKGRGR